MATTRISGVHGVAGLDFGRGLGARKELAVDEPGDLFERQPAHG